MTDDQKELAAKTICKVISDILYGPSGDPPNCNIIAAETLYGLIDDLELEETAKRVVRKYEEQRLRFKNYGSEEDEED